MELVQSERRREPRHAVSLEAILAVGDSARRPCRILDINAYGARVDVGGAVEADTFHLIDVGSGVAYFARVAWRQPPLVGTRFIETISLKDPDSPGWLVALRSEALRASGAEKGIRLVWTAPPDE